MGALTLNQHTCETAFAALKAQISNVNVNKHLTSNNISNDIYHLTISKPELDSHANMIVLGKESFVFESTGKTCNVEPFYPALGTAQDVPIVDAAIAYDCLFTHETYILIICNALHIKTMQNNLILSFIMREVGLIVNEIPKMHCEYPCIEGRCISFKGIDLRKPLQLNGILSYFNSRKPLPSELYEKDKVFITPEANDWNPRRQSYSHNESIMTNYEGRIANPRPSTMDKELTFNPDETFELASVKQQIMILQLTLLSSALLKLNLKTHHAMILMLVLLHV